jgi:hypothetical protein
MTKKKTGSLPKAALDNRSRQLNPQDPLFQKTRGRPVPGSDRSSEKTGSTYPSTGKQPR